MPGMKMLFIDDDDNFRSVTAFALRKDGYEVEMAKNGKEGISKLGEFCPDVVLCDLKMPVMDGIAFLKAKQEIGNDIPVIVLTAFGSVETAVEAMRAGAVDYLTKPVNREELRHALKRIESEELLKRENRSLRLQLASGQAVDRLIGTSNHIRDLRNTITKLAESEVPVLLRGESGTGKELAARALHFDGPRSLSGQFVVMNCAAIPSELLESELFGHRKGSFTGANTDHIGKFEAANNGTLFLDEIGDMPQALQAKLLRALQEGEVTPIGENSPRKVNVRVVAATNQPLEQRVKEGSFRQDLFYRLAVVVVDLPPLRIRAEDIEVLSKHFLAKYGSPGAGIDSDAMENLRTHDWPGNVRELENVIARACALRPRLENLNKLDLPPIIKESACGFEENLWGDRPLKIPETGVSFERIEKRLLEAAWRQSGENQTKGAELLGLHRQAFIYRLQKFNLIPTYGEKEKRKVK